MKNVNVFFLFYILIPPKKDHRRNNSFFVCYEKENKQFLDIMISILKLYSNLYQLINSLYY